MAKFIYEMQNILDLKEQMQVQAEQAFGAAVKVVSEKEEDLLNLRKKKLDYEAKYRKASNGTVNIRDLNDYNNAITNINSLIKAKLVELDVANKNLELAREKLDNAMKEKKTYENLKESAFEEFKALLAKEESKEIDELVSYTYSTKSK